jgi:hypothetical protein
MITILAPQEPADASGLTEADARGRGIPPPVRTKADLG